MGTLTRTPPETDALPGRGMFTWKAPFYIVGLLLLNAQLAAPQYPIADTWLPGYAVGGALDTFAYAVDGINCYMSGVQVPAAAWCQTYTQQVPSSSAPHPSSIELVMEDGSAGGGAG